MKGCSVVASTFILWCYEFDKGFPSVTSLRKTWSHPTSGHGLRAMRLEVYNPGRGRDRMGACCSHLLGCGWNPSWGWTRSSNQSGFPMSSKRLSKTDSGRRLHHPSRLPEMLWNLIFAFHGSMASTSALVSLIENVGGQLLHRIVKLNHPICHTFTMILVPHIQAAYNQEFETGSMFNSFLLPQWNAPMHRSQMMTVKTTSPDDLKACFSQLITCILKYYSPKLYSKFCG